ncbi:MAG: succinylglutamate desuccinylase/aspartoacylase family protein [Proteobacteria bacterium]|nr:succinylglutamate desuccinylase/aspartoacylase family protein [Pseudomonadota bacterium]
MSNMRFVPISTLANGAELGLHIHEIVGEKGDGPTVGISAAVHGNEPTGTHIILELARRFRARPDFRGRLLLLPVANPLAFEGNSRCTPLDHQNLNRLFPGDKGGWFTEQLAAVIAEEFLTKIDAFVDLHSGTDRPTVDYVYIRNAEALSRSFGSRILYRPQEGVGGTIYEGTSVSVTEQRDVPSVVVELGGGVIDQAPYIKRGVAGVLNILKTLKVLDGEPAPPPPQIVVRGIELFRPTQGGFLETDAPPLGEEIAGGAVLGRVVSPYTFEEVEVIKNSVPHGIMILSHLTRNLVQPGDYGYMVGDLDGHET